MCKHATGINNTHPKQYLILYSSYLFKWKFYVYYFDFFLLHIYIYIWMYVYFFFAKVSYSCYVLEISLFQIFIYIVHSVGISFIYVEQILFSLGYFNYHMGTIGYSTMWLYGTCTTLSFFLSFFLSWVSKTQPNHWTHVILCFCFWIHTASAQVARKHLARRNSSNEPWTHECCFEVDVFVCCEWIEELEWLLMLRVNISGWRTLKFWDEAVSRKI